MRSQMTALVNEFASLKAEVLKAKQSTENWISVQTKSNILLEKTINQKKNFQIFPIATMEKLFEIENDIIKNRELYLIPMQSIIKQYGFNKSLARIIVPKVLIEFNYVGMKGKKSFQKLTNFNSILYDDLRRKRSKQNDGSEYLGQIKRLRGDVDNQSISSENSNEISNQNCKVPQYIDKKLEQLKENIRAKESHEESDDSDTKELKELLEEFDLIEVLPYLKDTKVTFRSLKYMRQEDFKEALPPLGLRVEFREKLFLWHKQQFARDDETLSAPSKVQDWLNKKDNTFQATSTSFSALNRGLQKDLLSLLKETAKGKALLKIYKINQKLSNSDRDDLINIIVEEIVINNCVLNPKDFRVLVEDICALFPTEITAQEYYYIARNSKKKPSGKLFMKYNNKRSQRNKKKVLNPCDIECTEIQDEINDANCQALKNSLRYENSNWTEVLEQWKKTFGFRQKDLKKLSHIDFLKSWPKFSDARAVELINMDFQMLFPKNVNAISSQWEAFKETIKSYYEVNLHNKTCKQLFALTNGKINKDSQDYIFAILLNGVLPPTYRFKDQTGKTHKKIAITDSIECFVLHLLAIDDYEQQINDLIRKYNFIGLTMQPFIIVEGVSQNKITNSYVCFNKTLYKMHSFVQSLDICFKIFQTLSLKYPQACEAPWVFIQQYFFNIRTEFDYKSANLTSLINFLGNSIKQNVCGNFTELKMLMEAKFKELTDIVEAQNKTIMEALATQKVLTEKIVRQECSDDVRNMFPLNSIDEMHELNGNITANNRATYVNVIKSLLKGKLSNTLTAVFTENLILSINIDGIHGKQRLKDDCEVYEALMDAIRELCEGDADKELREALKRIKKRHFHNVCIAKKQ